MTWTHRPALDGVRTVAVYLVVLYHAGITFFGGGFVGVDLFFVLSGFLVSTILLDELDRTGGVRLGRFYARRVRRLLPAALVAVTATAAVFVLVAPVVRRLPLVGDAQAALLYVANWRNLSQSNDYFGAEIDRSPFLHFWSLSIEEQFYVFFPLLLLLLVKLRSRWRYAVPAGVVLLLVASVVAQVVWSVRDVNHAYYGTDARVYQLLAGVAAALFRRHLGDRSELPARLVRLAPAATVAGLVVLVVTAADVGLNPSQRGLVATVASVALVLGVVLDGEQWTARVLGWPTMTYLGRISYGTYLWHWPVVLVLREVFDAGSWTVFALTAALATGLAALSFHVLEHPIRTSRALAWPGVPTVLTGVTASAVLALLVVPPVLESRQRPVLAGSESTVIEGTGANVEQEVPSDIDYAAYLKDRGPDNTYCTADDTESCVVHEGGSGLHVALVGDSHARMMAPALEQLAQEHDFTLSLAVITACSWQRGVENIRLTSKEKGQCEGGRDDFYDRLIEEMDVDVVLLAQAQRDDDQWYADLQPIGGEQKTRSQGELAELNLETIEETVASITDAGAQTVIFENIIRVPDEQAEPLECLSGAELASECRVPVPLHSPPSDSFYETLATGSDDVATVAFNDLMCPAAPVCDPLQDGLPVWRDSAHYAPGVVASHREEIWERLVASGFFG